MLVLSDEKYQLNHYGYVYNRWELTGNTSEHQHLYYEFMFIYSGTLVHAINNTTQYIEPNTLVLIRPADSHSIGAVHFRTYKYYNVMISPQEMEALFSFFGDYLRKAVESPKLPPVIQFSVSEGEAFRHSLETVYSGSPYNPTYLLTSRLLMSQIFYKFLATEPLGIKQAFPQWFNHLLNEMQAKENFTQGLPALLRISGKSHEYLCRAFKQYLSDTPSAFINETRLKYACYLLRTTDFPVVDILLDAGFNNISHFNHVFKKRQGCTPLEYRRSSRISNIDSQEEPNLYSHSSRHP